MNGTNCADDRERDRALKRFSEYVHKKYDNEQKAVKKTSEKTKKGKK